MTPCAMHWLPAQVTLHLPSQHPSYPGHFPQAPIIPGVLLLEQVLACLQECSAQTILVKGISVAKFLLPLLPGEAIEVRFSVAAKGNIRFQCWKDAQQVASGTLEVE